jgi:hypothetical protein
MLDVAEAIAVAAAARKESRGAHACRDHPKRNDAEYLHHSMIFFTPGIASAHSVIRSEGLFMMALQGLLSRCLSFRAPAAARCTHKDSLY